MQNKENKPKSLSCSRNFWEVLRKIYDWKEVEGFWRRKRNDELMEKYGGVNNWHGKSLVNEIAGICGENRGWESDLADIDKEISEKRKIAN